jgi:hypothetical protein
MWTMPAILLEHDRGKTMFEKMLTLSPIFQAEVCQTKLFDVLLQGSALGPRVRFGDECFDISKCFT